MARCARPGYGIVTPMLAAPAAIVRLLDGQPVQAGDLMLLIDHARDAIHGEMRAAKARLQRARAA